MRREGATLSQWIPSPMPPYVIHSDGSVLQGESIGPDQLAWEYHPSDLSFIRIDHQSRIQVEGFEFVIGLPFHPAVSRGPRNFSVSP